MKYRIGVDIGGTFTDFALFDDVLGVVHTHKRLTTPDNPSRAVIEGLQVLIETASVSLSDVSSIVHGTTLVTNAVLEKNGSPTAMLVTQGFRDVLDIAFERRYDLFDLRIRFPEPIVPRSRRFEVPERMGYDGKTITVPDFKNIGEAIEKAIRQDRIEAIAVCFLHSYIDPSHENAAAEWLANEFPNLAVSTSADVFPFMREYERWTTACINAYVRPVVDRYLDSIEQGLSGLGFTGSFLIMSSSGGTLTPAVARRFPVRMIESGPAAGALMSAKHGRSLDLQQLLSFDMGGTTAKGCIVQGGRPLKRYEIEVARVHEFKKGSGLPIRIPVIDMIEIGAGGGSIAEVDPRGTISVGPRSAGALPGPACYGQGGRLPTLTDANLVLGYLASNSFLGGQMQLDLNSARQAIDNEIAIPLGVTLERAAWGIHDVINEDVARAFRVHASERGLDYRRCSMVAFGGSGPVHAVRVARKLKIPRVIIPWGSGVMSAFGLLASPIGFELVRSLRIRLDALTPKSFNAELARLSEETSDLLIKSGVQYSQIRTLFCLDMRYVGQGYEIEVDLPENIGEDTFSSLPGLFHEAYSKVFGMIFDDRDIEIVAWKVDAQGPLQGQDTDYALATGKQSSIALKGMRPGYMSDCDGFVDCAVYDRYVLSPGDSVKGPAMIEEHESTCVLGSADIGFIDDKRNLVVELGDTA